MQALKAHHGDYNPIADEADRCLVISNKYERFSLIQAGDGVGDFSGQPTKPVLHPDNDVEFFSEPHSHQVELGGEGGKQGLEFIIRLPPCGQVTESEDRVKNGQSGYGLPPLYTDILFSSRPNRVSELEILRARVADYTMRSCR